MALQLMKQTNYMRMDLLTTESNTTNYTQTYLGTIYIEIIIYAIIVQSVQIFVNYTESHFFIICCTEFNGTTYIKSIHE